MPPPEDDGDPPAAIPPIIDPARFEDYPAFRETFLLFFTDPSANATMRAFGQLLHEFVLEFWGMWPSHPGGIFAAGMRAAVADLRHVQSSLQEWTGPAFALEDPFEIRLARVGAELAEELGELADRLETELGTRPGEA
jgi:hypothetical protein